MREASSGHLSRSRAAQARLPRPIRERSPCWRTHESHRPALELLRATVRGAPDVRGAVHPPTALVCWQVQGARRPPMAQILRHHRGGARPAPPGRPVDETGGAPTTRALLSSTAQPTHRLLSVHGRRPLDAALEAVLDGCLASSARQQRGGGQELAPSAVPMPRCAPRPGKARARGPDGGWSSIRLTPAAWPVRPDPLPSWGGFGAPG